MTFSRIGRQIKILSMIYFTDPHSGRISALIRHERARFLAQVPGKAHRQILIETCPQPRLSIAWRISVYRFLLPDSIPDRLRNNQS